MAENKSMKSAIESMLFGWGEPQDIKDKAEVLNLDKKEVYECCF